MIISDFSITNIRSIKTASISAHPHLNLITGDNGSGKSSFLEALQCLSVGHSFRTRKVKELISHSEASFQVTGILTNPTDLRVYRAGLEKTRDGSSTIRINFEEQTSLAELTRLVPMKALTPESHQLIQDGPEVRRQFLDWGVFHVEHDFLNTWRTFRRALIQRNQLLRDGAPDKEIDVWDDSFIETAEAIDRYRKNYVDLIVSYLQQRSTFFNSMFHVELKYRSGWTVEKELRGLLTQNRLHHRKMKTTTDGPHRADLLVSCNNMVARQVLSRGQQKTLVYLLHLCQLDILKEKKSSNAIVICDDLVSELDPTNLQYVMEQLNQLDSQVFITGVNLDMLTELPHKGFHVKHGVVQNIV